MAELNPEDEQAVDRLTLQLLQDAYCDVAALLLSVQPEAARGLFHGVEQRIADTLSRLRVEQAEGPASQEVLIAVGIRLSGILDQAHGHPVEESGVREATGAGRDNDPAGPSRAQ
jgi:hypothetical protein